MGNFTKLLFLFSSLIFIFNSCSKEVDDYYKRPEWLQDPIYTQLESRGNFKNFLSCVDKATYKQTLQGAGYFTLFAPNDDAFAAFFTAQGISGIDAIDAETARKIVTYSLVYNSFEKARLSDYQSNLGWVPMSAYRRRTAYYTGVYTYSTLDGRTLKVTASNRNAGYLFGDNNNKYIPYFISEYMTKRNLSASDYNYFYPSSDFTGFNVAEASVVNADIVAENGMIHEIDRVILPPPSIDEYVDQKSEYKVFKDLMEKYAVSFQTHPDVTSRYKVLTGSDESVYVKFYSPLLGFSPNNENYFKLMDNDGQSDNWSMFIPNNDAVNKYVNEVLLGYGYTSVDKLPSSVMIDFINAHLWPTAVWPSKFATTSNTLGEEARFNTTSDILEAKMLSNGMLYGTGKAQDADVFRSVYGKAYLNPNYSLMTRFIQRELKSTLISPKVKFTLFLVPDAVLKANGHDYNTTTGEWTFATSRTLAIENWTRMINLHILITEKGELNNLSGKGIVETFGGEMIKYDNNKVFAAGNQEGGRVQTVAPLLTPTLNRGGVVNVIDESDFKENAFNGKVYYLDNIIKFPTRGVGSYIRALGDIALLTFTPTLSDTVAKPYKRFFDFLNVSSVYFPNKSGTEDINGAATSTFHTIFIPTDAAINKAVADGVLPATVTPDNIDLVNNFILYHIIPKVNIINNGRETGSFETLYKTLAGDATKVTVTNIPGVPNGFTVTDQKGNVAKVVGGYNANVVGNRVVIHRIDNYLKY